MEKLIKLSISPKSPAIETFDDIVIKATAPYTENNVTIQINPNITHYQEKADKPNIDVRQVTTTSGKNQSLALDFKQNNTQNIKINNKSYEIKLMKIDKEEFQGQKFPYFESLITKI